MRAQRHRRRIGLFECALLGLVGLTNCATNNRQSCGPLHREPLDSRAVHVLAGAPAPQYSTHPPTSGPHFSGPKVDPVQTHALSEPTQVGLLESGTVLIQFRGLKPAEVETLKGFAKDQIVVAPAGRFDSDAHIVLTAWVTKLECERLDVAAIAGFASDFAGKVPGQH